MLRAVFRVPSMFDSLELGPPLWGGCKNLKLASPLHNVMDVK